MATAKHDEPRTFAEDEHKTADVVKRSGMMKGVIIGGVSAFAVSAMFLKPLPTNASAAVLLSPLATIGAQINSYLQVMNNWVDQWIPDLSGLIDDDLLSDGQSKSETAENAVEEATRNSAKYHAEGGGKYLDSMSETLGSVRNSETGKIDPVKAAAVMSPPTPIGAGEVDSETLKEVWDHAAMMTGDEPLKPVRETQKDTLAGTEYEYKRIQTLQTRLLAQESIQAYPLAGPRMEGYREHLEQVGGGDIAGMTPGQIAAAQLELLSSVEIPVSIDQLESSLRQERMLGAMLAQQIQGDVDNLIASGLGQ